MPRTTLEVASIFRQHGKEYRRRHQPTEQQQRIMRAIECCRTSCLGGHIQQCGKCGHARNAYNSCRNRHCPKCQGAERQQWLLDRMGDLLPIQYFHVVFTLPPAIAALALQNTRLFYGLLFRISAETLLTIAADPKHLGAEIGFFSVLHTWGQNLLFHPHIHCVATGGGLAVEAGRGDESANEPRFISTKPGFFLPVRVLSALFRRLFLDALAEEHRQGRLQLRGELSPLAKTDRFAAFLAPFRHCDWVVYAKPPFGGPQQVLAYLARYTHRVAIANERLRGMDENGAVSFGWKDYRCKGRTRMKAMQLEAEEFIRRFLLHTLPSGLQRIRHYGLLANCHRRTKLKLCRELLVTALTALLPMEFAKEASEAFKLAARPLPCCPVCGSAAMARSGFRAVFRRFVMKHVSQMFESVCLQLGCTRAFAVVCPEIVQPRIRVRANRGWAGFSETKRSESACESSGHCHETDQHNLQVRKRRQTNPIGAWLPMYRKPAAMRIGSKRRYLRFSSKKS